MRRSAARAPAAPARETHRALGERGARSLVRREGLALAAGSVLSRHEQRPERLARRVPVHECFELGHRRRNRPPESAEIRRSSAFSRRAERRSASVASLEQSENSAYGIPRQAVRASARTARASSVRPASSAGCRPRWHVRRRRHRGHPPPGRARSRACPTGHPATGRSRRSRAACDCRVLAAADGGWSPHSPSTSSSQPTSMPGVSVSRDSRRRGTRPRTSTERPPWLTSSVPRTQISMLSTLESAALPHKGRNPQIPRATRRGAPSAGVRPLSYADHRNITGSVGKLLSMSTTTDHALAEGSVTPTARVPGRRLPHPPRIAGVWRDTIAGLTWASMLVVIALWVSGGGLQDLQQPGRRPHEPWSAHRSGRRGPAAHPGAADGAHPDRGARLRSGRAGPPAPARRLHIVQPDARARRADHPRLRRSGPHERRRAGLGLHRELPRHAARGRRHGAPRHGGRDSMRRARQAAALRVLAPPAPLRLPRGRARPARTSSGPARSS